jgi:B-cell lymphoma/leukemia 11A
MCSTCKNKYNSAWRLVQHVQNSHGVNIYIESAHQQHQNQGKSSSSRNNNVSGSSSNSSGSSQIQQSSSGSSSSLHMTSTNVPRHHSILPPPEMHPNPFGLLRMPLPPSLTQVSHNSVFGRNHEFRMDQFEQFRHHGLNLAAAAVAAANQLNQNSLQERSPPSAKVNVPPIPQMEAHLDFYSQRLRQLAGTTSPNTILSIPPVCSPNPRKQQNSPSFASPSPSQLPPTPLTNNSRPHSITPPQKSSDITKENGSITATPRSASTPPNSSQSAESYLSCDFCEKRFKFQSNLIVHRRTHTGEDKYKCTSCDFSCTQVSLLRRHMKLHQNSEDRNSNSGSVETENDDSPDDLEEDEGDMDGFVENSGADEDNEEAEDLRISNVQANEMIQDAKERHLLNSQSNAAASLVGELMDKFGLSNIAQYSEAYKQALQESGNALKLHLTNKDRDNNNTSLSIPGLAEKLNGFPAALRLKEELIAKNMMQHQNSQMPQVPLFNPFENPFDTSKRLKLDGNDSWWNLANFHRNESLLENIKSKIPSSLTANQNTLHQQTKSKRNDTCEYCGKVFKNCSNLTVHRRSHTGEKPYKCELCSYACAQSSKLTRHMKTHGRLGKDVYRCRFCEMPFSVPSTLEKHMR